MNRWFLSIVIALFLSCLLWMGRYTIFPISTVTGAYKLDRFTGEVTFLEGDFRERRVKAVKQFVEEKPSLMTRAKEFVFGKPKKWYEEIGEPEKPTRDPQREGK